MSSARFFPKNAVHSVQPYALLGGDAESPLDARGNDGDGTDRSDRVQGVRENAAKKEMLGIRGDHEPAVEYIERGGVWEPVDSLDDGDDNNSSDHGWNFDNITSDLEEDMALGDVGFRPKQRAMDGREGRKGGMARWAATTSMAASVNGVRDRYGNDFSLSPEGTSQYHLGQRWQARNSGGRGNRPSGRGPALNTGVSGAIRKDRTVGGTSFSDSEVTRDGFEPKWRARNREGTTNGVRRWKPNGSSANVPTKGWMGDDFGSNSDSGRDFMLEPKWKTRNRLNRSENNDGHANAPKKGWMDDDFGSNSETTRDTMLEPKWETLNRSNQSKYDSGKRELKYSPNSYNRERPERSMRGSNGNGRRDRFVNRFASDLEEPKWKPRRKDGTRTNSGSREHVDSTNGRFRRSSNGAARLLDARPLDTNSGASGEDGGHRTSRNGGRRSRGNGYSLRPTSDLRSPGRERGSDEM
uniref:Uncharacterized protein n=2 Tax=Oryza brachyantha TaxID=4533 RepID=J3LDY2_ORYBR